MPHMTTVEGQCGGVPLLVTYVTYVRCSRSFGNADFAYVPGMGKILWRYLLAYPVYTEVCLFADGFPNIYAYVLPGLHTTYKEVSYVVPGSASKGTYDS
jgi:hypothetical protein